MKICERGCDEEVKKGIFKQDHGQKIRILIEKNVGGLIN